MYHCSLCGYCDAVTVKKLNKTAIDGVELHVRNELLVAFNKLKQQQEQENTTVMNEADLFGNVNLFNPSTFKFSPGERVQIEEIALYVQQIASGQHKKYGIETFKYNSKEEGINHTGTAVYPQIGRLFITSNEALRPKVQIKSHINILPLGTDNETPKRNVHVEQPVDDLTTITKSKDLKLNANINFMQSKLYCKIVDVFKTANIDEKILQSFSKNMTSVHMNDNNIPIGTVKCILCSMGVGDLKSKKAEFIVQSKANKGTSWIASNFKKHILKHFDKSNEVNIATGFFEEHNESETIQMVIDPVDGEEYLDDFIDFETDKNEQATDSDENSQKLHSIMYHQVSSQLIKMEAYIEAEDNIEKQMDMKFTFNNDALLMKIFPMEQNGSCLYSAICNQWNSEYFQNPENMIDPEQLRAKVVDFIDKNYETFKHSLQSRVYEKLKSMKEISNMDYERKQVIKDISSCLNPSDPVHYGGCESLLAVSKMFNVNVLVIKESGEHGFGVPFDSQNQRTLVLANSTLHYDSVVSIDDSDLYNMTLFTAEKIQSSNLNQNTILD